MDMTVEQQKKGLLGPFRTAKQLDGEYGVGNWRFVPRFLFHQAEKDRLIDDAKRGGQNEATFEGPSRWTGWAKASQHLPPRLVVCTLAHYRTMLRGRCWKSFQSGASQSWEQMT